MTKEEFCEIMDNSNFMIDSSNPYDMKILEALGKQIPKKPIDNHHCPSCETGLPHKGITDEWCKCCFDPDFCPTCGQRLNWSDTE